MFTFQETETQDFGDISRCLAVHWRDLYSKRLESKPIILLFPYPRNRNISSSFLEWRRQWRRQLLFLQYYRPIKPPLFFLPSPMECEATHKGDFTLPSSVCCRGKDWGEGGQHSCSWLIWLIPRISCVHVQGKSNNDHYSKSNNYHHHCGENWNFWPGFLPGLNITHCIPNEPVCTSMECLPVTELLVSHGSTRPGKGWKGNTHSLLFLCSWYIIG